ncbi:MAG TPA: hypothetical protein VG605_22255, partial [Puia sp.]|nr:hypothetical protein [Puia sp.]
RMMKFVLQAGRRWPAGQLRGHDRRADLVALVIETDIINAVMAVSFGTGIAGFGGDIVGTEDRIVLVQVTEMIMLIDAGEDAFDGLGERRGIAGG